MAGIAIELTAACLDCPMIDVDKKVDVFYDCTNIPYRAFGSITCSHARVCKHYDPKLAISRILDGERVGS